MRNASIVIKLVVPEKARIAVLLHDYTTVAEKDPLTGRLSTKWKENMIISTKTLDKKIDKKNIDILINDLHTENYSHFAKIALQYYDELYDNHIKNEEGSGSGVGVRNAITLDLVLNEQCDDVNGIQVGQQVLKLLDLHNKNV